MKGLYFFILCLQLFVLCQTAQSLNLYVIDPRNSFTKYPGTIEDIRMTVKPHGSYCEVGLYLTFSPRGSIYNSDKDTLEAVLDFELAGQAFINDMWLFLNDTVCIKARIRDKWTAGFIYEGIVQRRQDPSILTKSDDGRYKIKVFPLIGNSTRTVKINCFVPCNWTNDLINADLPINFANASYKKPAKCKIYAYTDSAFAAPAFTDVPYLAFTDVYNTRYGNAKLAEIDLTTSSVPKKISFRHVFNKGIFINYLFGQKENFYQLIINPANFLNQVKPKNVVFLVDYDSRKTNFTRKQVFDDLKRSIYRSFNKWDSFNIFISNQQILKASNRWIPADSSFVEAVFNSIEPDSMSNNTYLPELLYKGVQWANDNSADAEIVILASSDSHGSLDSGNAIGEKTLKLNYKNFPISIASFVQKNWTVHRISGQNWAGNNYLYNALANMTHGVFNKITDYGSSIYDIMVYTLNSIIGGYTDLRIQTSFTGGYGYDEISNDFNKTSLQTDAYSFEFGKFTGYYPGFVEITGYYRNEPFRQVYTVKMDNLMNLYDNRSIWAGNFIRYMEWTRNAAKYTIWDIVNKSLDYKVLSIYTAFLATEDDERDTLPRDEDIVPVELVYFDAAERQNGIDIIWATATELNNMGFYIDRQEADSKNGWQSISFTPGYGNSNTLREYSYFDKDVIPNTVYQYRLRQIDLDGTINTSPNILTVAYQATFKLALEQNYPNPVRDETKIRFSVPYKTHAVLEIFDIMGRTVARLFDNIIDANQYDIIWNGIAQNGESLPNGLYICRLTTGNETRAINIIINK